jgi:hypothetical protein
MSMARLEDRGAMGFFLPRNLKIRRTDEEIEYV